MGTEEGALLQAVAENPDDDAVRLIYADWLEEHGDLERAEYVRLACIPSGDWHRCRALLAAHRSRWLAPLFQLGLTERVAPFDIKDETERREAFWAGRFLGCEFTFSRGLVSGIRVWGGAAARALVTAAAQVFACVPLRDLTFSPAQHDKEGTATPLDLVEPGLIHELLGVPDAVRLHSLGLCGPGPGARFASWLHGAARRMPSLAVRLTCFHDVDQEAQRWLREQFGDRVSFSWCGDDYCVEE
jgi:uncharacterized protein (TIGR02996 family)